MKTMSMLVRREFWEHRSLWLVPLVVAIGMTLLGALASLSASATFELDVDGHVSRGFGAALGRGAGWSLPSMTLFSVSVPIFAVGIVVVTLYALDCLNAERRDRSILFWKSMPVSDARTVAAKFLTATVAVPVLTLVLWLAAALLTMAALSVRFEAYREAVDLARVAQYVVQLAVRSALCVLWWAPVVAALMLLSGWARRWVAGWAVLVPAGIVFVEYQIAGTSYALSFIKLRLMMPPGVTELQAGDVIGLVGGVAVAVALLVLAAQQRRRQDAE